MVPGWVTLPPEAATNAVVEPAGSCGDVAPVWAGPAVLLASYPVSGRLAAPTPALPPKGMEINTFNVTPVTETIPMFALPPGVPLVVNTLPVASAGSVKVVLSPMPMVAALAVAVGATLKVALAPPPATAVMVVLEAMPPVLDAATEAPTSAAENVAAAAVMVATPLVHEVPVTWRPAPVTPVKVWL